MVKLEVNEAIRVVRKNLEEVGINASGMYNDTDNRDLDRIITSTIPDAVNAINAASPSALLDGVVVQAERQVDNTWTSDYKSFNISGRTVEFSLGERCLRIVAVRAFDSDLTVSEEVSEVSPVGRMQLNPFTCGAYDDPVLVRQQTGEDPTYRYYSLEENNSDFNLDTWLEAHEGDGREPFPMAHVEYLPYCEFCAGILYHQASDYNPAYYDVPSRLKEDIVIQLTGMVLAIYGEPDKAKYFFSQTGLSVSGNEKD